MSGLLRKVFVLKPSYGASFAAPPIATRVPAMAPMIAFLRVSPITIISYVGDYIILTHTTLWERLLPLLTHILLKMSLPPLVLDEDESFSMQANVTTPGPQSIVLRGYITQRRPDGLYIASLLPQLFFGADGSQLSTWRQNLTGTGEQTILSRSGGLPTLPREELYWRRVGNDIAAPAKVETVESLSVSLMPLLVGVVAAGVILWAVSPKRG